MKYVFLAYRDEDQLDAMSAQARALFEEACRSHEQDLRHSGHLYALEDLQNSSLPVALRLVNDKLTFTDSLFGFTKGLSVQLFFIQARDLNAAIQIASQMPQARAGLVEVRRIVEFE